MCGIVGILALARDRKVYHEQVEEMADQIYHRGPDDSGYYIKNNVGFGFRRLSIIDLEHGNQPFYSQDKAIISICNGEIYNYKILKSELKKDGYKFSTNCDVEVLIPLYEKYGVDFVSKLSGQFSFAIFDERKKRLILARDQVGIAPLFYTIANNQLFFGSEIKSLLVHKDVQRNVNLQGLDQILSFPGVVSPTTMFQDIHSVEPGSYIVVGENYDIKIQKYWSLDYPPSNHKYESESFYFEQLEDALLNSVKDRLNADVPVGFYLSGGLDSSLIGGMIRKLEPDIDKHSFSIAFEDKVHDESSYQQIVTKHIGSIHHNVTYDWRDVAERLKAAVYFSETPLKESYNTCSLSLSELVKKNNTKVILTGEGADELFCGYVGYRFDEVRNIQLDALSPLDRALEEEERSKLWGDKAFFYESNLSTLRETKLNIYSDELKSLFSGFNTVREGIIDKSKLVGRHYLHKRSYIDFKLRLSDHLVSDHGDRVSYANSIEARYPFLDLRVIEAAKLMPPSLKLKGLVEKYIVKEIAKKYIPNNVAMREKFHFVAPSSSYLLRQNVEWVNDLLSYETIKRQGYFCPRTVERLKRIYMAPNFKLNLPFESDLILIILTFGIFLETFKLPNR